MDKPWIKWVAIVAMCIMIYFLMDNVIFTILFAIACIYEFTRPLTKPDNNRYVRIVKRDSNGDMEMPTVAGWYWVTKYDPFQPGDIIFIKAVHHFEPLRMNIDSYWEEVIEWVDHRIRK